MSPLLAATFSWDPVADWRALTHDEFMRHALIAGTIAAVVCGLVGHFVVLRGLSFASDALTHVGFAGASGAVLLGLNPAAGLLALTGAAAAAIGVMETRLRGRDVVIGMVLVEALGLGVLFLRLYSGSSNQTYALLFGNILSIGTRDLAVLAAAGGLAAVSTLAMFRPLLFASLDEELARARGVPVRALAVGFLLILALAVLAATQVIGALLAVALLVAPAASAHLLTRTPPAATVLAVAFAMLISWAATVTAFWVPYPVSFFATSTAALVYAAARGLAGVRDRRAPRRAAAG